MGCIICNRELTTGDLDHTCLECKRKELENKPMLGWMCPRCGAIHSPFKSSCGCYPETVNKTNME